MRVYHHSNIEHVHYHFFKLDAYFRRWEELHFVEDRWKKCHAGLWNAHGIQ